MMGELLESGVLVGGWVGGAVWVIIPPTLMGHMSAI